MFSKFDEDSQKVLLGARKEMINLKHPYVGSEHLLLAILSNEKRDLTIKLSKYGITYEKFKNEIIKVIGKGSISNTWFLYTPLLKRIIESAAMDAKDHKCDEVSVNHLFMAMLEEGDGVAIRLLMGMKIDVDLLYEEFSDSLLVRKGSNKNKLLIEEYAVDLNKKCFEGEVDPVIGRDNEINSVIEILCRRCKNNPLLIGEAGVGKTAIIEELANRINLDMVPDKLKNKRILSVAMASLVAGTKYRGEFEERINKILKEVEDSDNIILFIDEIHTLIGAGGAEGAIDASNILKPALARGKLKLIGATTNEEYSRYLEKDKALDRRFQKINIEEPNIEKTKDILFKLKPLYEDFHNVVINNDVIDYLVNATDKYIHNRKFPDKAIDILDEVCAKTIFDKSSREEKIDLLEKELKELIKQKKNYIINEEYEKARELKTKQNKIETKINKLRLRYNKEIRSNVITKEMVIDAITKKTMIPIFDNKNYSEKIKKISKKLNEKVLGQEEVIERITNYTKKKFLGYGDNKVHSFLLVGKTGVGKTLLVKEYARLLYNKDSFIRVDMSEYKEAHSISKIIGSPPGYIGYDDDNYLLNRIKNNPFSILLLDEIEKAHNDIIKLFLQVLDESKMKDAKGNTVYFNNVVIFMTSNFGCENKKVGFSNDNNSYLLDKLNSYFSVEFINRIDDILVFNSLDNTIINKLIRMKLNNLKDYYSNKNIKLLFNKSVISEIYDEAKPDKYGARKIDKVIDSKINNYIIDEILNGKEVINVS